MAQSEIKKIIRQLKKKEIRVFDVSEEYENEIQIVTFERKAGLRITGKKGFDIISNTFFVEETNERKIFSYPLMILILILIF